MQVYEQLENLLVLLTHNFIEIALLLVILLDNFYLGNIRTVLQIF